MYSRKPAYNNNNNKIVGKTNNSVDSYYDGRRGTIRLSHNNEIDEEKQTTKSKCKYCKYYYYY